MGMEKSIIQAIHTSSSRDYLARMLANKAENMAIARRFDREFFDGPRNCGYGGYRYDGRWAPVAHALVQTYNLPENARILDAGCGKGFLLYEMKKILPNSRISGFDISSYAIAEGVKEIRNSLFVHNARDPYACSDGFFDLAISLNTLHNLKLFDLKRAINEFERCAKQKYLVVESYRNEKELFNLQCWGLTCQAFFSPEEWKWIYEQFGYTGDYEFIYFE
jgi:SAM-dependent methyltransferase